MFSQCTLSNIYYLWVKKREILSLHLDVWISTLRDIKHHHWAMYDTMPLPIFWRWCHFSLFCLVWFIPLSKDKTTLTKHFLELRTPWRSLMKPSTSVHSIIYYNMIFLFICFVLWQKTSVKSMCDSFKALHNCPHNVLPNRASWGVFNASYFYCLK
jgi:hypothetical protein